MSDVLNPDVISQILDQGVNPFQAIHVVESVDSTNEWCLQQCKSGLQLPFACIANRQTNGRGRRGRVWYSAAGASITMSYVWPFKIELDQLGMLSLAVGMTVVDVLRAIGIDNVMLKWPNDVIVNGYKIAGILIETVRVKGELNVIIGLGLNYEQLNKNDTDGVENLKMTDVCQSLGTLPEGGREQLVANLLREAALMCESYQANYGALSAEFDRRYNALLNLPVNVLLDNGDVCEGLSTGITGHGELKVVVDGMERVFNSAEVSLRKAVLS